MKIETQRMSHGVVVVRMMAPETANALGPEEIAGLTEVIRDLQASQSGATSLVLTGCERVFSAGADLKALQRFDPTQLAVTMRRLTLDLASTLREGRLPTIAAVNGPVAGGAVGIALSCDIVLAAPSARFMLPFARLGLLPDSGLTYLLPQLIGEARARALAMLAENVGAEQAAAWGLIYKVAQSDASLLDEAVALGARLGTMPAGGHRRIRETFVAARTNTFEQQVELECTSQAEAAASEEFKAALAGLLRKP